VDDEVEFIGKTVEDAIGEAERALGTSRDQLTVEIISQGSRGVFGIGAESARIRARPNSPDKSVASPSQPAAVSAPDSEEIEASPAQAPTAVAPSQNGAIAEEAQQVLENLLRSMSVNAEVSIRETEDPIMLAINGRNLGILIGRRGDNLAALQFMVNLILSKNRRQWPRVVIDVENYRARREESLRTLADRIAYRVRQQGRPFTLEAMPASDRRIIHLALRESDDLETYSIGEGPARRVVVAPKHA